MSHAATDLLRVVSILAVLVIHGTGRFEESFAENPGFNQDLLAIILNQIVRFAVPVFIFLSGWGLASRYSNDPNFSLKDFFLKRMSRIGLPFVFWTIVFLFAYKALWNPAYTLSLAGAGAIFRDVFFELPRNLFLQGADYHFYFFIIILQCYLIFPIVRTRRSPWILLVMVIVHLIFTFPGDAQLAGIGLAPPRFTSSFIIYWVLYFYAGVYFAGRERGTSFTGLNNSALYLALLIMIVEFLARGAPGVSPGNYDHFNRWSVTAYALLFLLAFARYFGTMEKSARISYLGGVSFTVYILHTTLLRFIESSFLRDYLITSILVLWVSSFLLAIGLEKIVPWKWPRIILGLPESPSSARVTSTSRS